jgi:ATP-binding cassette, subfamily F, member 3
MISIQNLTKGFERENLFEKVNVVIHPEDKIAIVGKNGAGKTTFFRCLAGLEDFSGRILAKDIKISLMEQEQNFSDLNITFEEYLIEKEKIIENRKKYLEEKMGIPSVYEDEELFNSILDNYNLLIGDKSISIEQESIKDILMELGITEINLNTKIKHLSGGQKTKLRLAECLSKKADIYLLDEPTNNLDLTTRKWVEKYINENLSCLLVISHDRYFLSKIIKKVWDLENKKISEWRMDFGSYLLKKKEYLSVLERKYKDAMKRKKILLESAEEKRHWASLCGNRTKRVIADRLEREAKKLDEVENPFDFIKNINIDFEDKDLHKCTLFRLEGVSKNFEETLFEEVYHEIEYGEKICVLGENGTGKSTYLKILMGLTPISSGEIYKREGISIGYFDQELAEADKEKKVIDFLRETIGKDDPELIAPLQKYGFNKNCFNKQIKFLSGGEKARLNILRISIENKQVLILDEPTNNLDVYLIESLEKALKKFKGTVIFVSHDRYFLDNVAQRVLEIKNKKISSYSGNYSEYLEKREDV